MKDKLKILIASFLLLGLVGCSNQGDFDDDDRYEDDDDGYRIEQNSDDDYEEEDED
jgi:hypothetical protein